MGEKTTRYRKKLDERCLCHQLRIADVSVVRLVRRQETPPLTVCCVVRPPDSDGVPDTF